jgi:hypothetical protein
LDSTPSFFISNNNTDAMIIFLLQFNYFQQQFNLLAHVNVLISDDEKMSEYFAFSSTVWAFN